MEDMSVNTNYRQRHRAVYIYIEYTYNMVYLKTATCSHADFVLTHRQQLLTFGPLGPGKPTGPCGP